MLTLAFDTATGVATSALVRNGEVLGERERHVTDQRQHDHLRAANVIERLPHEHDVAKLSRGHERNGLAGQS